MITLTFNWAVVDTIEEIFEKKGNVIAKIMAVLYVVFVLISLIGLISAMVVYFGKHQNGDANLIFTLIMFGLSQIFAFLTIIFYRNDYIE